MDQGLNFLKDIRRDISFDGPFEVSFEAKNTPLYIDGAEEAKREGYIKSIDYRKIDDCILIIELNPSAYLALKNDFDF